MLGLFNKPPEQCIQCKNFANDMALLNTGYVGLDQARDTWINYQSFQKQSAIKILGKLISITIIFTNFFVVLDRLYNNKFLMSVPQKIVDILADEEKQSVVKANIMDGVE